MLIVCTPSDTFAYDNATNILYTTHQKIEAPEDQQTLPPSLITKQKSPQRTVQPAQQSYVHALIASSTLGGLNALGCCLLERCLPLWWPINIVAARISCSLLLPSIVYAYLAFAEGHGITCHCSTMHTSAFVTDWVTYLAIKKYH